MNRSLLHGGPVRGNAGPPHVRQDARPLQDARSPQDARSNLAIQPAASAGTFKLKKKAVRIVSVANPAPHAPLPRAPHQPVASTSLLTPGSSSALGSAPAKRPSDKEYVSGFMHAVLYKADTGYRNETPAIREALAKPSSPAPVRIQPPSNIELPTQTLEVKGSLEDMFARLSAATGSVPSRPAKELSPVGPDKSVFSFEDQLNISAPTFKLSDRSASVRTPALPPPTFPLHNLQHVRDVPEQPLARLETLTTPDTPKPQDMSHDELEQEYLRKAAEYISVLPPGLNNSAHTIKAVSVKLQDAYTPNVGQMSQAEVEKLRARYVFAVVNFVNKKVKLNPRPLKGDFVEKVLRDSNGSLLKMCAALIEGEYISLDSLEQITGLCKNILDVLPKAEDVSFTQAKVPIADMLKTQSAVPATPAVPTSRVAPGDPLDGMKAWPTQEKREHGM